MLLPKVLPAFKFTLNDAFFFGDKLVKSFTLSTTRLRNFTQVYLSIEGGPRLFAWHVLRFLIGHLSTFLLRETP